MSSVTSDVVRVNPTGTNDYYDQDEKTLTKKFGKYNVLVRVDSDGRFLDIEEISIDKVFADLNKTKLPTHYEDVKKFYLDE